MLGVDPDASDDALKRAYRAQARAWHPDRNPAPDAAERFKQVARAWERLSDPNRRRAFDLRARRVRGGELPEPFLEDVATAVERAQDWIEQQVLPHYAAAWRGRGAEVAARLWVDAEDLARPRTLPVTARGRRRAAPLLRTVFVSLDERPSGQLSALIPGARRFGVVLFPAALWAAGFRDPIAIDDAVLRLLLARYAQIVAVGRMWVGPGMEGEALVAAARRQDDEAVAAARRRWALWAVVGLIAAFILAAGFFQW